MPDGKQLIFVGNEAGHQARCYLQNVDGGRPRAVTPEGMGLCQSSPDGKWVAAIDLTTNVTRLYPTAGGDPQTIKGLGSDESLWWSADPKIVYVVRGKQGLPMKVYKLNIETGKRELFKELNPTDTTGICDLGHVIVSRDGRAYIYGYTRLLSDLYLVKGI
jgi:dipeptidyl aminopeptidase/acylaminoacyl peptidase